MGGGTGQGRGTAPVMELGMPVEVGTGLWGKDPPRTPGGVGGAGAEEDGKRPVDPIIL